MRVLALVADLGAAAPVAARVGPLSPASAARLERIRAPLRRAQSAFARQLAALAATQLLGRDVPAATVGERGDDAGLAITGAPGVCLSISHSRDQVAVAVGEGPLGIDIERCDGDRDCLSLARYCCSAAERAWLEASTPEECGTRFYLLWTLREAAFKAGLRATARGDGSCFDPGSGSAPFCWGSRELGGYRVSVATAAPTVIEWFRIIDGEPGPLGARSRERLGRCGATAA